MANPRSFISAALAVATFLATTSAFATEVSAYDVEAATVGNEAYTGALGMDFDVLVPINVYALGVYDSGQDGLAVPLVARLYDRDNAAAPRVTVVFAAGATGTLVNGSRYLPLPCPLSLPAGFHGTIEADGYGPTEPNGTVGGPAHSTNTNGAAIAFVGSARTSPTPGAYPTTPEAGPANRFAAGTFTFATTCASDKDCTNPAHPKCAAEGVCGSAVGDFFPACTGTKAACDLATATCVACNGDFGSTATKGCADPQLPACMKGACVECNSGLHCKQSAPVCGAWGTCGRCAKSYDAAYPTDRSACPSDSPFCLDDGTCAPIESAGYRCSSDDDCVEHDVFACDMERGRCVMGCRGTIGCPAPGICSSSSAAIGKCSYPSPSPSPEPTDTSSYSRDCKGPHPGPGCPGVITCAATPASNMRATPSYIAVLLFGALVIAAARRRR